MTSAALRVALVIERFEPRGGGVEAAAWNTAHALAAAGQPVTVITRRGETPEAAGVSLSRVEVPTAWQPLRVLAFSRAAGRRARELGSDVVHSFSRTLHQHVFRAGGGSHADYMARAYDPAGRFWRQLSPRHRVLLGIERRVFANPNQWIQCNSAMVRDELTSRYRIDPGRLVVIPNGVDLERFHPEQRDRHRGPIRDALGVPAQRVVWLLVGSGFHRKGVATAIAALAAARPTDAELWVAGRDAAEPWRARAERAGVGGRVRFLGARDDLDAVYAAADGLLLPTRYDAFANVCLEAAAAGLPVVTSGANGAAGWLGEAGACVDDPEDVDGFASTMTRLAEAETRTALGRAARRRAEGASWQAHAKALRALYARVVA